MTANTKIQSISGERRHLPVIFPVHDARVTPNFHFRPSLFLLPFASWILAGSAASVAGEFTFHHENVLGTTLEIQVKADDKDEADRAEFAILASLDQSRVVLSEYDSTSEFRRWQETAGTAVPVSEELFGALEAGLRYQEATKGAVHPGVAIFSAIWANAEKSGALPDPKALAAAAEKISLPLWQLDPANRTARRQIAGPLTLHSFSKGLSIDRAGEGVMASADAPDGLLINLGGDLRAWGSLQSMVGIANPTRPDDDGASLATLSVQNLAVATSGGYQRGYDIGGRHYSHLIDPRTGQPASHIGSATVAAPTAELADALATALCILPARDGLRLIESTGGAECLLVDPDGRTAASSGWGQLASSGAKPSEPSEASGGSWEWVVNFEIRPAADASRYRRPYVAVWVEDASEDAVRTLVLWLREQKPGPKWHRDLRRWYMNDLARRRTGGEPLIGTISGATRPPGEYQAIWDGRDDGGKILPQGDYTLYIEAAREHGTYQLIRQVISLGSGEQVLDLPGNAEINSATLTRRLSTP